MFRHSITLPRTPALPSPPQSFLSLSSFLLSSLLFSFLPLLYSAIHLSFPHTPPERVDQMPWNCQPKRTTNRLKLSPTNDLPEFHRERNSIVSPRPQIKKSREWFRLQDSKSRVEIEIEKEKNICQSAFIKEFFRATFRREEDLLFDTEDTRRPIGVSRGFDLAKSCVRSIDRSWERKRARDKFVLRETERGRET